MNYREEVFDKGPKSLCRCGHTGDGINSDHQSTVQGGHGACKCCNCEKFTWSRRLKPSETINWITQDMAGEKGRL